MRIDANQLAVVIGVAVAGPRRARLDVAHDRTGIAADLVTSGSARRFRHREMACLGRYHSYTNDVARAAGACQAPLDGKTPAAEYKLGLPLAMATNRAFAAARKSGAT